MAGIGASSGIRMGGLATGLDSQAIIEALMQVERLPIVKLEAQKARLNQQDGIFAKLDGKLDDLRRAIEAIDTLSELGSYSATSSTESVLTVSAGGTAATGSWSIAVSQIAQAESQRTAGFADANSTDVGTGTISITAGGTTFDIALLNPTNTLEDIRTAINNSAAPVTATIINDGSATNPYQLVLTSDQSGASNAFTVDLSAFTPTSANFNFNTRLQQGQDATFTVNGLTVNRSSNTVTDVIPGLTLNLKSGGPQATSTVTVSPDTAGTRKKIEDFIKAYNEVVAVIAPQSVVDSKGQTSAVLFGDSSLRSITSRLRSALTSPTSGTGSIYDTLAAIGVRTGSDGKLSLNQAKFDAAVAADLPGVLKLFTQSGSGVAQHVKQAVDDLTNATTGIIQSRRNGVQGRIRSIDRRIDDLEQRMTRIEEQLVRRYSSLETFVSSFQAQGSSLSSLASLNG